MILAAYMVAGFLVASVYAVGMLRGRRDRYHRLGFADPVHGRRASPRPSSSSSATRPRAAIAEDQPAKFAAMEYVTETGPEPARVRRRRPRSTARSRAAIKIPDLDSFLVGFSADTVVTGLDQIPDDEEPPAPTLLHLAFDAMVGIGTALFLLAVWFALALVAPARRCRESPWFLRAAAVAGVARDRRAGVRLDRHRGRPPAVGRLRAAAHRGRGHRRRAASWISLAA